MARLPFIDWVRGFAVVAMVLWHTVDGWLSPPLRDGQGWMFLRFVGGLAAPSFLFLAGVSAALSARGGLTQAQDRGTLLNSLGRGFEIVLVGYLLRYQTWMIDAAAIRQLGAARAWLPLGVGYAVLVWSVRQLCKAPSRAGLHALLGAVLCVAGFVQVESVAAGRLARLLQVDVLQAIGMSLVLLGLLERGAGLCRKPWLAVTLGVGVAALSHASWSSMPGALPDALAGYLGKWDPPAGRPPAALFPLLPWFSYACLGAAVGSVLRDHRDEADRVTVLLAVAGAGLATVTSEAHPYMHQLFALAPWLVHPARVAFRVGIVLSLFAVGLVWAGPSRGRVLLDYGRSSLRIYWAHMLFAYGVFGRPLQKASDYGTWALWATVLLATMWLLAQARARKPSTISGNRSRLGQDAEKRPAMSRNRQ